MQLASQPSSFQSSHPTSVQLASQSSFLQSSHLTSVQLASQPSSLQSSHPTSVQLASQPSSLQSSHPTSVQSSHSPFVLPAPHLNTTVPVSYVHPSLHSSSVQAACHPISVQRHPMQPFHPVSVQPSPLPFSIQPCPHPSPIQPFNQYSGNPPYSSSSVQPSHLSYVQPAPGPSTPSLHHSPGTTNAKLPSRSIMDPPTVIMFERHGSAYQSPVEWLNSIKIPRKVESLEQVKEIWEVGGPSCPPLKDWTVVMRNHKSLRGTSTSIYSQRKFLDKLFQRHNFDVDSVFDEYKEVKPGKLYKLLNSKGK